MTYDKALDYIMPAYMDMVTSTLHMAQIEDILIKILIRNGATKVQATRYVIRYLDN